LCKFHRINSEFHVPDDPTTPIIMVGPGTGIAPFMGFLEERKELMKKQEVKLGEAHLFFGCRNKDQDFLYQDRLTKYVEDGVLSEDGLFSATKERICTRFDSEQWSTNMDVTSTTEWGHRVRVR
jgi:cytochrome P450 / NADPH-cytochrome P450 reductase